MKQRYPTAGHAALDLFMTGEVLERMLAAGVVSDRCPLEHEPVIKWMHAQQATPEQAERHFLPPAMKYKGKDHRIHSLSDGRRYIVAAPGRMYLDADGNPQDPRAQAIAANKKGRRHA